MSRFRHTPIASASPCGALKPSRTIKVTTDAPGTAGDTPEKEWRVARDEWPAGTGERPCSLAAVVWDSAARPEPGGLGPPAFHFPDFPRGRAGTYGLYSPV